MARDGRRSGLPGLRLLSPVYEYRTRRLFKCKGCGKQFSVTSGTTFHGRKLPIRDYLMAIAIFANAAKGISALQLGRDLDVSLQDGLRAGAQAARGDGAPIRRSTSPQGHVEIDGAYFGGHRKPANFKANRVDRRLAEHQTGKRRVVVVMRERQGRTLPFVVRAEDEGVADRRPPRRCPARPSTPTRRPAGMPCMPASRPSGSTTASRSRTTAPAPIRPRASSRACAGPSSASTTTSAASTCGFYAGEMAWREDMRRENNGDQYERMTADALHHPKSRNWCGYWQRHVMG